jgi:hypothetical protein
MAPQHSGRRKEEDDIGSPRSTFDDDDSAQEPSSTSFTYTEPPDAILTPTIIGVPAEVTSFWQSSKFPGYYSNHLGHLPPFTGTSDGSSATGTSYSTSHATPLQEGWPSVSSSTPTFIVSYKEPSPSSTATDDIGSQHPEWAWQNKQVNHAPMYAAASIIPLVLLAAIGAVVFLCMRKRKRQRHDAVAAQIAAHEMKKRPQTTAQAYMAPPTLSMQYTAPHNDLPPTSTPSQLQPVILGPIPSGSNGAYLTGMDTSDMVSITSNNLRPVDPFADNNSLAEPPPPYRPHSVAPPSFTSTSRQSSVRTSAPQPATSRTHLIERSPFEDPQEDDTVSELSGPTLGRHDDGISIVSDLSYQNDPYVDQHRPDH